LERALSEARETVENPELLAAAADATQVPVEDPSAEQHQPIAEDFPEVGFDHLAEAAAQPHDSDAPEENRDQTQELAIDEMAPATPAHEAVEEPSHADQADAPAEESPSGHEQELVPPQPEAVAAETSEQAAPHLEVVESAENLDTEESAAEISDKVDRLLEELREVT
jgi:hypothetical protein